MVNVTVSVPEDLKKKLEKFPEINWSEVARQAWEEKARQLELLNELTRSSTATDADIAELSRKIKKSLAKKYTG
jgi:hypothetical protein